MRCPTCGEIVNSRTCPHCGSPTQSTSQHSQTSLPPLTESESEEMRIEKKKRLKKAGKGLIIFALLSFIARYIGGFIGAKTVPGYSHLSLADYTARMTDFPVVLFSSLLIAIAGLIVYLVGNRSTSVHSEKENTAPADIRQSEAEVVCTDQPKASILKSLFTSLTPRKIIVIVLLVLAAIMLLLSALSAVV